MIVVLCPVQHISRYQPDETTIRQTGDRIDLVSFFWIPRRRWMRFIKNHGHLTFSMLTYCTLKYPQKCASAEIAGAHIQRISQQPVVMGPCFNFITTSPVCSESLSSSRICLHGNVLYVWATEVACSILKVKIISSSEEKITLLGGNPIPYSYKKEQWV